MVIYVSHVPERKRQGNPYLRGSSVKLCSRGGLLGVHLNSHNVPYRLGMGRLMNM